MKIKTEIETLLKTVNRKGIDMLIQWLNDSDFFTAPASTQFHGNYEGGLAEHSYKVYKILTQLNKLLKRSIQDDQLIISGLLHDVCKVNFYVQEKRNKKIDGKWKTVDAYGIDDKEPLGHGAKSIILLQKLIPLTDFELYAIMWHMGKPQEYSDVCAYNGALKKYPDIIMLHVADYLSSTLFEKTVS